MHSLVSSNLLSAVGLETHFAYPRQSAILRPGPIIAIRIDNQFELVGTVSRLPLHLLPNGTSPERYEPHLAKWVLLFTQSTHRQDHLLRTQFLA